MLAYTSVPLQYRTKLHSTDPLERLDGEIKAARHCCRILFNENVITRFISAVLLEQTMSVPLGRYMTLERISQLGDDPIVTLSSMA